MTVEKKILRLLIVDDSPDDAELAADTLRAAGYMLKTQRVQDMPGMQAALGKGQWDIVVSEHALAQFEAQHALDLVRRAGLDLPLVVLTRKMTDSEVLKIMRAGARDVVFKNQAARLVPVVEREVQVAREHAEHSQTARAIKEIEDKHRALIEGSREAVCYCHDGMHIDANRAYLALFGYESPAELEGVPLLNMLDGSCHSQVRECLRQAARTQEAAPPCEFIAVRKDGTRFPVEITASTVQLRGENCYQLNVTDISRRKAVERKLQFLNQRDPLTGLYNRHFFLQELARVVEQAKSGGELSVLLYLDLDQLKDINDTHGHAAGDRLLLRLARLIREKVRENDLVARFGGDEFTVLMSGLSRPQAQAVADDLLKTLKESSFSENGKSFECRCTLSLTEINASSEGAHKVLSAAYRAYYETKARKHGMPPPQAQDPGPAAPPSPPPDPPSAASPAPVLSGKLSEPMRQLRAALEGNGLQLVYQPVINLQAGDEEGYEVLVRMAGEGHSSIPAAKFIPAAERSGLVRVLDRWVVQRALRVLGGLHQSGKRTNFFINLSGTSLGDADLIRSIERLLAENHLPPGAVVFDINESALVEQPEQAGAFIQAVRASGCRVAVDHYGVHLGAIPSLRHLPVDFLNIDGKFIDQLAVDEIDQAVVQALVQIGRSLGKLVIAKSVQDADSLALLWRYGVDYVQGNFFQQPESQLSYAFEDHSVSSDQAVAGWISAGRT